MAGGIKVHKHAPYRKSFLIPLWTIQLSLSTFLLVISGIDISFVPPFLSSFLPPFLPPFPLGNSLHRIDTGGSTLRAKLRGFDVVHMLLNLFLISSIIFVIVRFANFTLTTHVFKVQSIVVVIAGVICTVLYFPKGSSGDWIMAVFPGTALLASIAICARVCVLRRRVKKAEVGEMNMGIGRKEVDVEAHGDVELEDGNKFRVVDDGKVGATVKVAVGYGLETAKPRPSFNSVGTGTSGAPENTVREFV
jgi:hypothetical protein